MLELTTFIQGYATGIHVSEFVWTNSAASCKVHTNVHVNNH